MKRWMPTAAAIGLGFTVVAGTTQAGATQVDQAGTTQVDRQLPADGSTRAPVVQATDSERAEWIDFEFYRDSRIFLPVTINGYATVGVLDTGAASTAIDLAVAQAAGIQGTRSVTGTGTGGTASIQLAPGVAVRVGQLEFGELTVGILDLSGVADRLLGRPLPVILGVEIFEKRVVDIDYPRRRIAFRDPDTWEYQGDGTVVPLSPSGSTRTVALRVEGGPPIRANLDTGQSVPLTILKPYADAIHLLDGRPSGTVRAGGVGGATIDRLISVKSVDFGGVRFEHVPVVVPSRVVGAFNTKRIEANVGTGFFSRFRMIVDFPRNRLILEADTEALARPFRRNRAGLFFERTGRGLEIAHVSAGSPAAEVGLAVGDVVTRIDERAVGEDYWSGGPWRWTSQAAGTVVEVSVSSGRSFTVRLADYY